MIKKAKKNQPKISAIIQARMGSERLPGKVLLPICGKPVLLHIIERLESSKFINQIILAIPDTKENDILEKFAKENSIEFYRGSEEWVLQRFYFSAKKNNCQVMARITADNPLIDPSIIDMAIQRHLKTGADYTCTHKPKKLLPLGLDAEVFNFSSLKTAYEKAKKAGEKEHVTLHFYQNPDIFKISALKLPTSLAAPDLRLTLDTAEDLELITKIYENLYKPGNIFETRQVLDLFLKNPELKNINAHIIQKAV